MMLKAATIVVAALLIGKSAELAIPAKPDATSYGQHKPVGKPYPPTGTPGGDPSSANGTVQDAASKPTPEDAGKSPYPQGPSGYPVPAQNGTATGNEPDGEDAGEQPQPWYPSPNGPVSGGEQPQPLYPSPNGTVSSGGEKPAGGSSDDGRPWINHNPAGPSLGPSYPGPKNSSGCSPSSPYQNSPNNGTRSAWNGTEASPTSRPGEKIDTSSPDPSEEDDDEEEDTEGGEDDGADEEDEESKKPGDWNPVGPERPVDGEAQSPSSKGPFEHSVGQSSPKPLPYPFPSPPNGTYNVQGKPNFPKTGY